MFCVRLQRMQTDSAVYFGNVCAHVKAPLPRIALNVSVIQLVSKVICICFVFALPCSVIGSELYCHFCDH